MNTSTEYACKYNHEYLFSRRNFQEETVILDQRELYQRLIIILGLVMSLAVLAQLLWSFTIM